MKLSKVINVMDTFKISPDKLTEYTVDTLDENRLPNTRVTPDKNPEAIQVGLMRRNGTVEPLNEGQQTKHHLTSDVIAVHVEFRYKNGYHKAIFVR